MMKTTITKQRMVHAGRMMPAIIKNNPDADWASFLDATVCQHMGRVMPEIIQLLPDIDWGRMVQDDAVLHQVGKHLDRLIVALLFQGKGDAITDKVLTRAFNGSQMSMGRKDRLVEGLHIIDRADDRMWRKIIELKPHITTGHIFSMFNKKRLGGSITFEEGMDVYMRILNDKKDVSSTVGLVGYLKRNPQAVADIFRTVKPWEEKRRIVVGCMRSMGLSEHIPQFIAAERKKHDKRAPALRA